MNNPNQDRLVALDYETYYGRDLSVKLQGPVQYAAQTQIFLVGVYAPTLNIEYVGPPGEAPWEALCSLHWVSHHAGFDSVVHAAAVRRGLIPPVWPQDWDCSADLCAYLGLGRSLKEAVKNSFGEVLDKTCRDRAGNRYWPDEQHRVPGYKLITPVMQQTFLEYTLQDARASYRLWDKWHDQWPAHEREFSKLLRWRNSQGISIDVPRLNEFFALLTLKVKEAREKIPWEDPPLSRARLLTWCNEQGIESPASTAETNDDAEKWLRQYGEKFPVIGWLRDYRKLTRRLTILGAIERRLMPGGRMNFSLKYHGAGNTGRLSGSDGLNMQNLNRDEADGVDLRSVFMAAPGQVFVIADFAQVEPRVLAWVCKDKRLLELLKTGVSFYEVDAQLAGVWKGEPGTFKREKKLYQLQKAQSLGLGYGMGPKRFIETAKGQLGLEFSLEEACRIREAWHARYPAVRRLWSTLERAMWRASTLQEPFRIRLPSGRFLSYFDLKRESDGKISAATTMNGTRRQFYWGGVLVENVVQAIARDLLVEAILRLENAGIPVVFSAHDEVVCEVPIGFQASQILSLMVEPPGWAADLPLSADKIVSTHYCK